MLLRYFSAEGRLRRAQKKIARGKFENALRMLVDLLNKGVEAELAPSVYLALAEAETGCGNFGNAGYYARQCEAALPDGSDGAMLARAKEIQTAPKPRL